MNLDFSDNRKNLFEEIAYTYSSVLRHSAISVNSLGEFATLLYLIKTGQIYKAYNIDVVEGDNLFVLQFSPSMVGHDFERWMRENIRAIGLMRKSTDQNPEIESIMQSYRNSMRLHRLQESLIEIYDSIVNAQLEDNEYLQLLVYVEQVIAQMSGHNMLKGFIHKKSLSQLMAQLPYTSRKVIYDPFMGIASTVAAFPQEIEYYGVDINRDFYNYSILKLELSGRKYHCQKDNSLQLDIHDIPADCIITIPPFRAGRSDEYIEHTIKLFRDNQHVRELVLLVSDSFLEAPAYSKTRKQVTEDNQLDKVLKLPCNYFYGMSVPLSIVHLRKDRADDENIIFYNFSEDAEKDGRNVELNWRMWEQMVEYNFDNSIFGTIQVSRERVVQNNYDWAAEAYPMNDFISTVDFKGEELSLLELVVRYHGEQINDTPEKILLFRQLNSPFDKPEEVTPQKVHGNRFIRVTEPVLVVGYSNKCPLYYLEASEDTPAYVSRREIMYKCISPLLHPLYLACEYSASTRAQMGVYLGEYIYMGCFAPNVKIDKFLRAQKLGFSSYAVQLIRVEEYRNSYAQSIIEKANVADFIATMKEQYKEEVRSRKHNMRPFLRRINSNVNLMRECIKSSTSIEDLKSRFNVLVDRIDNNARKLSNIIDRLSQEDKFEDPVYLDIEQEIQECVDFYLKNTSITFRTIVKSTRPECPPADEDMDTPTWGKYAAISKYDFRRMLDAIIENARVHGFEGKDEGHCIEIEIDYDWDFFRICITNDGIPFPEGFDINQYGLIGKTAGKHAGTGDGGHQVVAIADHFGGYVEIESSKPDDPSHYASVIIYLRVIDKDFDDSLYNLNLEEDE